MVKDLLDGTDYKGDGRCMFMIVNRYDGSVHRCEKMEGHWASDDKRARPHVISGIEWSSDHEIHVGPNPALGDIDFHIDGLWLTSGGRIVKPGPGEITFEEINDVQLMTAKELQNGIRLGEFQQRLNDAMKKQHKKFSRMKVK